MAIPNWCQIVSWKRPVLPPPLFSSLKNQSSKGQLPPRPRTVLGEWSPTAIFKKFRCLLDIFSLFFVCISLQSVDIVCFTLSSLFKYEFFFFFYWSRNANCHSSGVSERGVCVCAVGGRKVPGANQFLQILSEIQKYIQEEASSIRWIAAPSHSPGCVKQPRWSRCCVSAQPRVERSQLMIQLNKTWKRAERHQSGEGSTFSRCHSDNSFNFAGDTRGKHVSGVTSQYQEFHRNAHLFQFFLMSTQPS